MSKDKTTATLLAFFMGGIGIHRFYLNQPALGIFYLLFFWTGIPLLVGFIDFLVLLFMGQTDFDYKYNRSNFRYDPNNGEGPITTAPGVVRFGPPASGAQGFQRQSYAQRGTPATTRHDKIMGEVAQLKQDIQTRMEGARQQGVDVVADLAPLVETYVEQVKALVERDKRLSAQNYSGEMQGIQEKINQYRELIAKSPEEDLRSSYDQALSQNLELYESVRELARDSEKVRSQIDGSLTNLKKIKFDLDRLSSLGPDDYQKQVNTQMLREKSQELSTYINSMKQSYGDYGLDV